LVLGKNSELETILNDPHGGYVACGFARDSFQVRGLLGKFESNGSLRWEQHYTTGNYLAYLSDIKLLPDSGFIMCGTINHTPGGALQDYLIIKTDSLGCYQSCTSTGITDDKETPAVYLFCYPNPVTSEVTVEYPAIENLQQAILELWSPVTGRSYKRIELQAGTKKTTIDCNDLNSGLYMIKLSGSNSYQASSLIAVMK
jgi:hypothetical protein